MSKYLLILLFVNILMIGCSKGASSQENVVVKIDGEQINIEEVANVFKNEYYDVIVDNLINEKLLDLKAKELGIDTIEMQDSFYNSDKSPRESKINYQLELTKEVLKKTINESTLKEFYESNKEDLNLNSISVTIYSVDHEVGSKLMTLYQRNKDIESVENKLGINESFKEKVSLRNSDELFHQLEELQIGEMKMVMSGDSHQIVLVNEIQSLVVAEWPRDRDAILEEYLFLNTYNEKIMLLEELKNTYKIERDYFSSINLEPVF
ncbi:hypothetical protein [Paenibacillus sp. KS-LC4]|uniref:hypothetical protein n=1 Tax=Paenibacillus sp. KS-LC4 TaxID=2979727 RepID=UPI0030D525A8